MTPDDAAVTSEMIEAGREPLAYFYSDLPAEDYDAEADRVVREIYMAMMARAPRSKETI